MPVYDWLMRLWIRIPEAAIFAYFYLEVHFSLAWLDVFDLLLGYRGKKAFLHSACANVILGQLFAIMICFESFKHFQVLESYCKSKLELKSNSGKILPVNCKLYVLLLQLKLTKLKFEVLKLTFCTVNKDMNTDKLAINWLNFHSSSTSAKVCFYNTALRAGQLRIVNFF